MKKFNCIWFDDEIKMEEVIEAVDKEEATIKFQKYLVAYGEGGNLWNYPHLEIIRQEATIEEI